MEINLQSIEYAEFSDSEKAIFNVLKATLQCPADAHLKGIKLADDINFFCKSANNPSNIGEILWNVWAVILDVVRCVPPGHQWHISLIQSLENLRKLEGPVLEQEGGKNLGLWNDLPQLSMCVREQWSDPTDTSDELSEEFEKWKSLNSFIARLTSTSFAPWLHLPIWQLRIALEEPPIKGSAMECRLWVACEWILQCGDVIFKDINSKEELDEHAAQSLRTGSLYSNKPPLSIERWEFWKNQLSQFVATSGSRKLDDDITKRISDALKYMSAVEK